MTIIKIVSLALFAALSLICINNSYALICDGYQNYSYHSTTNNKSDTLLKGCEICGFFQSNVTTASKFKGTYIGCLSSVAQMARTTDETLYNVTAFIEQCRHLGKGRITLCDDSFYPDRSDWDETSLCCCQSDYCTRNLMDPSIPLAPTASPSL
uniref:Protein sleepless n=1 Tax=Rhabditophanes sp. KR3021 TaxID=114890 RepID=A0AC35U0Z8_9BILA